MNGKRICSIITFTLIPLLIVFSACISTKERPKFLKETLVVEEFRTPVKSPIQSPTKIPPVTATTSRSTSIATIGSATATITSTSELEAKGSIIFAGSSDDEKGIYLYDLEKKSIENLTQEPRNNLLYANPSWSPDGTQIVYSFGLQDTSLFLFNFNQRRITKIVMQTGCNLNGEPDWSPDGKSIVFVVCWKIFIYNIIDQQLIRLTNPSDINTPDFDGNPAWSPDGEKIAFLSTDDQLGEGYRIFTMDKKGQNRQVVASNISVGLSKLSWSPDGKQIAYRSREGCGDICVVDVSNGVNNCLTRTPFGEKDPDWSPDGQFIAYVETKENELCNQDHGEPLMLGWQLHILRISDGQVQTLTNIPGATFTSPDWLP